MMIYLAGPIDNANMACFEQRRQIKDTLKTLDHVVFDPASAWTVPINAELDGRLQDLNEKVVLACDMVVAFLVPNVLSIGTVMEIVYAHDIGTPVVVHMPDINPSWALASLESVVITHTDTELIEAVQDVIPRKKLW
jgi:nucleoside 2-deoxyribosyltransferase